MIRFRLKRRVRVIGWEFPYPSQRMPVVARNVVATSQPLAVAAGLDAMRAAAMRSTQRSPPRSR